MLTGLFVLTVLVGGSLGLVYGSKYVGKKWDELQGRRWEKKLLKSQMEVDDEMTRPSEEDIEEAERELAKEMDEWVNGPS